MKPPVSIVDVSIVALDYGKTVLLVEPNYPGGWGTAIKDLMRKAVEEQRKGGGSG